LFPAPAGGKLLFNSLDTFTITCLHIYVINVALMPLPAEQPLYNENSRISG
jgi:hypothetical protein